MDVLILRLLVAVGVTYLQARVIEGESEEVLVMCKSQSSFSFFDFKRSKNKIQI